MFYPQFEEALALSTQYDIIPVAYELYADTQTPINLFLKLRHRSKCCFLLESVNDADRWGRYSFIGYNPLMEISAKDYVVTIKHKNGDVQTKNADPFEAVREILAEYKSPKIENIPNFCGGLVGYFSYDCVRYVEKSLKKPPVDDLQMPDCHFLVCDEVIAFDHLRQKIVIIVNVPAKGDFRKNYDNGVETAKKIASIVRMAAVKDDKEKKEVSLAVTSNISKQQFMDGVVAAKQCISDGEIFQVVLSQRFEAANPPDSFDTYRVLRVSNPSPYMYYFKFKDYHICGASPEKLVSIESGLVQTRPIAGTIRRGKNEKEDKLLEIELMTDEKERAEHTMLVDLGRNDVGKVCEFGSVSVTDFMRVERYSQLMHLVSDVSGTLAQDKDCIDTLKSLLPAGTLSGAPKVRAMEIIDEMETTKRGLYGGTVGYLAFDGDMDTCIAIRTILYRNAKAYIQAGAGIVYDSVPEKEFMETEQKSKAMIKALMEAGEIL